MAYDKATEKRIRNQCANLLRGKRAPLEREELLYQLAMDASIPSDPVRWNRQAVEILRAALAYAEQRGEGLIAYEEARHAKG